MADAARASDVTAGRYELGKLLGAGGMGEVYAARDRLLDRPVALKVLPSHLTRDVQRVERLRTEARAASALNHPAIVTIYEVAEGTFEPTSEPRHFIAMEHVDGITLDAWLATAPPLRAILRQLARIAEGIGKAHGRGVIHRDLKPENLMITSDGFPKILDFGLAKLVDLEPSDSLASAGPRSTHTAALMGTAGYMAPEQVEGQPLDHRADIFALGCVLHEAVTGKAPFAASTRAETLHAIVHRTPPRLKLDGDHQAPLQRIVDRCLAKDREQRYDSARDLALDLTELVERMERHDGPLPRRRRALRFVPFVVVLLIAVAGLSALTWRDDRVPHDVVDRLQRELGGEKELRASMAAALDQSEREVARKNEVIARLEAERDHGEKLRAELEASFRSLVNDVRDHTRRNESERSALRQRVAGAESELEQYRTQLVTLTRQQKLERIHRELAPWSDTRLESKRLVITVPGTLFKSGSARIESEVLPLMRQIAAQLTADPELAANIEGHTDDRGSETENLALSQRRAAGIRELLIAAGIEPARVSAVGRGEQFPIYPNETFEGRVRNRRIEISLSHPAS